MPYCLLILLLKDAALVKQKAESKKASLILLLGRKFWPLWYNIFYVLCHFT